MFEVSDSGEIRNKKTGRTLKQQPDKKGYLRVSVTLKRKRKTMKVHREVAKAFIANDLEKEQVNHIDGKKENNRAENLEWVTNKENAHHAIASGLWDSVLVGSQRSNENRKVKIRAENLSSGEVFVFASMSEAERKIGTKHINDVIKGKRSQAKGFTFSCAS